MLVRQAIEKRRSVRHYVPGITISDSELTDLFEQVRLTPSSFNLQHWQFIVVRDPATKQQIREASWNQEQVTDAAATIVVAVDPHAFHHGADIWGKSEVPDQVKKLFSEMIPGFYGGKPDLMRDEALRSCGMAAMTLMVAAEGMGWQTCPMIGFDPQRVSEIVKLKAPSFPGMLITLGKADSSKPTGARPYRRPLSDFVSLDSAEGARL